MLSRFLVILFLFAPAAAAQEVTDTIVVVLPEITIDAARETETTSSAPFSVAIRSRSEEERAFEPATSLDVVLRSLPGVWMTDRGHYAMGERLTIRGMGARAAFGVRGVQVLLDDIPLTMPDGQAVLDAVEPAVLGRAELLRSPSSIFWGNGSGGVLFLTSGALNGIPQARVRAMAGGHGQRQVLFDGSTNVGEHRLQVYASNYGQDGFRDYSDATLTRGGAIGRFNLGPRTFLKAIAAGVVQDTEHPGSLTLAEFEQNPQMARPLYPDRRAGKESTQLQGGATLQHDAALGTLSATVYGITRQLDNPLPFAYIDLGRTAGGGRISMQRRNGPLQWGLGADAGIQHDDRKNFENVNGEPGPEPTLDQIEDVTSAGAFAYARYLLTGNLQASAGVRRSMVLFEMDDQLLDNGDQSGDRTFTAWSPSVGVAYRTGPALLFANYSTAFETPTTTELVNRPDMTGGFNPDLDPQVSRGFEIGARGYANRLLFDLALFRMNVEGRLVSFQNELGREFFRNAGDNTHSGIELGLQWFPTSTYELTFTYTGSRYEFVDDALEGKLLPGVPEHRVFAAVQAERMGLWFRAEIEAVSEYFVNDENTDINEAYSIIDLQIGHSGLNLSGFRLRPFAALRNVLDEVYSASVVVNAAGGRYYEPSPGRALLIGVQASI